jgi:hypothetical protein
MPRRLTRADRDRIAQEVREHKPPKPQPTERLVRLSCGHEEWHRVAEGETHWLEMQAVCGACRTKQMLSGHGKDAS